MSSERDYVLGTHDEEIERLGLQHRVWLPRASDAWRRAGFTSGQTLLDVGCGPGWATLDLAGIAAPTGRAIGVDRSRRFLDAARARASALGCENVQFHELDLDTQPLPAVPVDGVWSRWVYAFVKDPRALLARVAAVMKPGGVMVLHEYVDYRAWRVSPPGPSSSGSWKR
jgi:ubiquinone/menaquinone biosynthesis C-methylase UbiE